MRILLYEGTYICYTAQAVSVEEWLAPLSKHCQIELQECKVHTRREPILDYLFSLMHHHAMDTAHNALAPIFLVIHTFDSTKAKRNKKHFVFIKTGVIN